MPRWIWIHLTKGKKTIIDIKDYFRVKQYKWRAQLSNGYYYACCNIIDKNGEIQKIYLAHFIINFDNNLPENTGLVVDHKNRNTLDNRSRNLRVVTFQINSLNQSPKEDSKTGVVGISEYKTGYEVTWTENGERQRKYFSLVKKEKMDVFWSAYDFYYYTISDIKEYRQAFCFDEPENSDGSSIDEDDYEHKINPRIKNRNEIDNESGKNRIRIQGRLLRVRISINGERTNETFHFDKDYKGDLRDRSNQTWLDAIAYLNEMLEKKSKMKNKKIVPNKIKKNKDDSKILIKKNDKKDESDEMSIDEKCNLEHTILDLLNNKKCTCKYFI